MTISIQIKKERLSPDVPWYQYTSAYKSFVQSSNVGVQIDEPDNLTTMTTLTFIDQAAHDAFWANPIVVKEMADVDTYNNFAKIDKKMRQV